MIHAASITFFVNKGSNQNQQAVARTTYNRNLNNFIIENLKVTKQKRIKKEVVSSFRPLMYIASCLMLLI